jgi:hypothetical protein
MASGRILYSMVNHAVTTSMEKIIFTVRIRMVSTLGISSCKYPSRKATDVSSRSDMVNTKPIDSINKMPINRSLSLYLIFLEEPLRIRHNWFMDVLTMFRRLVATKNRKMKPPTVIYQSPPYDLTFSTIDCICSEVSLPNTFS